MANTCLDPHHNSFGEWKYEDGKLYYRAPSLLGKWEHVKRVSFTPKRFLAIADLIRASMTKRESFSDR